jgi:hypothetical protein
MRYFYSMIIIAALILFGCGTPTENNGNEEIINVTNPTASTIWLENDTNTSCDWNNAEGETIHIEIYKAEAYLGVYSDETENDGSVTRVSALGNWGTGTDYRLKVIDDDDNFGWSAYFTIESDIQSVINISYPNSATIWDEFQIETYCDWTDATGETVYIEIYKGGSYLDIYHEDTTNDGHCSRNGALGNWETGSDFRLKVIDSDDNYGWSEFFTIQSGANQINVIFPEATTAWVEYQMDTYCDWTNAVGDSVFIEIYKADTIKGIYHDWTDNDGHTSRNGALDDWGNGTDFRLKVIDANDNIGWSAYFTIEAVNPGQIFVIFPDATTSWLEFQTETYCDWSNASGDSLYIEIFKGTVYQGIYHGWTDNDGHCSRNEALEDWGNGTDFQLRLTDSDTNFGWSNFFTIESSSPNPEVLYPTSTTIWQEFQTNTYCDWENSAGDSVYIEIYKGLMFKGIYADWTNNDGHYNREIALDDWGFGNDFRLKVINSNSDVGWSDYFTIEEITTGPIIIYPDGTAVWQEFEVDTYCDWSNAVGNTIYIEIYKGDTYLDIYHEETDNDGHCSRNEALGNWGTGTDFRLKLIDAENNEGWSAYFTIE